MAREKKSSNPTRRRAKGSGSIFWNDRTSRYIGRVPIGSKLDGSTHYVQVSGETEAECVERMRTAKPPGPKTTVAEWAERWYAGLTVRPSTRADYRHTLDQFILPTLGHLRVVTLTAHQVEAAVKRWQERLGPNTARKNLGHLRACLEGARRAGIRPDNPAKDASKPKALRIEIDPFTPDELAKIIASRRPGILALLASIGCRIGEAQALDVPDFNPTTGEVGITKTYSAKFGIRAPKSQNGVRTVRVPQQALAIVLAAIGGRKAGPLFADLHGRRQQYDAIRARWFRLLTTLKFRPRRLHQLRHSVATLWVSHGVPLGDVAAKLGDTVDTVVRTYLHATGVDPSDVMERVLGGDKVAGKTATPRDALKTRGFARR